MTTKEERVRAALVGGMADRPAYAVWKHFTGDALTGDAFTEATLAFNAEFAPDLLKVMHEARYEMPVDKPTIDAPGEWSSSLPQNPPDSGNLGEQLRALRHIRAGLGDDAPPVVETLVSTFALAQRLTSGTLLEQLASDEATVKIGLSKLAATIANYAKAAVEQAGCAGIYFAVHGAHEAGMDEDLYTRIFLPLDRLILAGALAGWCNIVHLPGNAFTSASEALTKTAHAVSFGGLTLASAQAKASGKCILGGVDNALLETGTPNAVTASVQTALAGFGGGKGLILAAGPDVPDANLHALRAAVSPGS